MTATRVIAIDLGASSGRVVGVRFEDGEAWIDGVHRFPNAPVAREVGGDRRWCWDIEAIHRGIEAGLAEVASGGGVASIAVDSWAVDYGLVDDHGDLVAPVTAYRDERHRPAFERLRTELGDAAIYGRTGIQFQPFNTLYQLASDAADPTRPLERASRMLMIPDLVANRLCGSMIGEWTNAGSTQCFDADRGVWIGDLLDAAGVPIRIMPEVVAGESASPLGTLDPELAGRVGLDPTTPVRATASHDTAAAVAAAPLSHPGDVFISSGTWSLVGMELDRPVRTDAAMAANLTNEPGIFGTTRFLRNVSGLWLLQECRRAWAEAGRDRDWATMAAMAAGAPAFRTVIDPDDPALASPGDMPARLAEAARQRGEPVPETDAAMVRAILDSVALATARAVDLVGRRSGITPTRLVVVGGGAANDLLNGLISAATGLPVAVGPTEATALGNAVVQRAAALGITDRQALRMLLPNAIEAAIPEDHPEVTKQAPEAATRLSH